MEVKPLTDGDQLSLIERDPVLSFIDRIFQSEEDAVKILAAENLQHLVERFSVCQREFFLIVERRLEACFHGGPGCFPMPEMKTTVTDLWLGIIDGEVRLNSEPLVPIKFPIKMPYVSGHYFHDPKLWEGPRFLPEYNYAFKILMSLKHEKGKFDWREMEQEGINLAVGDTEVKDLICKYRQPMSERQGKYPLLLPVYKMCLLLGRFLHNFPEQLDYLEKHRDLFKEAYQEVRRNQK